LASSAFFASSAFLVSSTFLASAVFFCLLGLGCSLGLLGLFRLLGLLDLQGLLGDADLLGALGRIGTAGLREPALLFGLGASVGLDFSAPGVVDGTLGPGRGSLTSSFLTSAWACWARRLSASALASGGAARSASLRTSIWNFRSTASARLPLPLWPLFSAAVLLGGLSSRLARRLFCGCRRRLLGGLLHLR
jgi:hypothetical protein